MSWIAVDTELPDHDKMSKLPSDAARWGWICVLAKAKKQRVPGTFADSQHFRHVMGRHGKFLPDYLKAGLIDYAPDDERDPDKPDRLLRVHDWKRHQWAAAKAGQREDIGETSEGQKEDPSRGVPVPVFVGSSSSTEGVQGEPDAIDAFQTRTGQVPGPKMLRWLNDIAASHGEPRLVAAIGSTPMAELNVSDYLRSIQDRLRVEDARAERAEATAATRRVEAKRAPLRALPPANDVSDEEAKRIAAEYLGRPA